MHATIIARLAEIERTADVRIVYACESGSRAWGFASADSDFDVRFVFVRRQQEYLRLDEPRDVIELPIEGLLDINGWDLRKTLKQLRRSNPVLMEWLDSPIVYQETSPIAGRIRELTPTVFRPMAAWHHYLSMARTNFREALRGDEVSLKKYFYVLRPLFAVSWIEQGHGPVPMEFRKLMDRLTLPSELLAEIDSLLIRKAQSGELGRGPRVEPISSFIEEELARRETPTPSFEGSDGDSAALDQLFREGIDIAWQIDPSAAIDG